MRQSVAKPLKKLQKDVREIKETLARSRDKHQDKKRCKFLIPGLVILLWNLAITLYLLLK